MKLRFILFLALAGIFISCKNDKNRTPSGYDYSVISEGSGETAKPNEYVIFGISIKGDNGKVIQEMTEGMQLPTIQVPAEMPKGKDANPIIELLSTAKAGGKYKLIMPIDSIPNPPADLNGMKHVEYEIDVKYVKNEEQYRTYMDEQNAAQEAKIAANADKVNALQEQVAKAVADFKGGKLDTKSTASGLKYHIVKEGTGENIKEGQKVKVNYYGVLMDGTRFDDSFSRGMELPYTVGMGGVIKGLEEGTTQLKKGSAAYLFIPYNLAYGDAGSPPVIPARADLVFYVEVNDVE